MKGKLAAFLAAGLTFGCAQSQQGNSIAAMESSLTALDDLALQYTTLPPCPAATALCSDPAVKVQIKTAAQTAYSTIKAAESSAAAGNTVDLTAAAASLAAFQALVTAHVQTGTAPLAAAPRGAKP